MSHRVRDGKNSRGSHGVGHCAAGKCNAMHIYRTAKRCNTLLHTGSLNPQGSHGVHRCAARKHSTHCIALKRTVTHCNTLQHTATHCNTMQLTGLLNSGSSPGLVALPLENVLQHTALHCTTLHHTLHHTATYWNVAVPPRKCNATHCNLLQHTAIHCNTLQHIAHTATHCNALGCCAVEIILPSTFTCIAFASHFTRANFCEIFSHLRLHLAQCLCL